MSKRTHDRITTALNNAFNTGDSMRGLFFISKGVGEKDKQPCFYNKERSDFDYIGGYDPNDYETEEWYRVIDTVTFSVHTACGTLEKAVESVEKMIKRYKSKRSFLTAVKDTGVFSSSANSLENEEVFNMWGDFYAVEVRQAEERAYHEVYMSNPMNRATENAKKQAQLMLKKVSAEKDITPKDTQEAVSFRKPKEEVPKEKEEIPRNIFGVRKLIVKRSLV